MKFFRHLRLPFAAAALAACASEDSKPMAEVTTQESSSAVAVVEHVDASTRQAILKGEDGARVAVRVSEAAGGLENVQVGDLVQFVVSTRRVARIGNPDDYTDDEIAASIVGERDGLPARNDGELTRQVVEVVSVTPLGDSVLYEDASGERRTVTIEDPKAREFARGLKRFDKVVIDTLTTVSISVIGKS